MSVAISSLTEWTVKEAMSTCLCTSYGCFHAQWQSGVAVLETVWSAKSEIIHIWPFQKKFADSRKRPMKQNQETCLMTKMALERLTL